ncbi:MAG: HAMP domain-containing sensor histidine kinase [Candidatus Pacebacteria bacterium]|nr:HAMP domain-containing sensor histidine kinase [Candidatus Paceibacterota bacterium]
MKYKEKKRIRRKEAGGSYYLNKKCWLVKNLDHPPYKRCQYCELRFHDCLFMRYQVISLVLGCFSFLLIYLFERTIPFYAIVIIFTMVIVYGYYFNSSTEKIVKSNFLEKKAKDELKKLSNELENRVERQTKNIKKQNKNLKELLNVKSDFLRTVNHQLNTPLTIMRGAFSMMEDKSLSIDQGMKIASHGLERMSSTIEDFWDAFELEEQKVSVDLVETDIEAIVGDMVEEKKKMESVINKKLKIVLSRPNFSIPKVLCDQKKISHAISNLLDNAVFYTQKGSVGVRFEKVKRDKKNYLKVFISDTGEGIPAKDQKKIFEKFTRGSSTSSINPNGSGLGLYIAKTIIEKSGGKIILEESVVGKGTTFSFILEAAK